jgi:hypothetical protein
MNARFFKYAAIAVVIPIIAGCGGKQVKDVPKTVAEVNGKSISSSALLEETYRKAGKQILTSMIEREVLLQWAKDDGVPVEDKQVTSMIETSKRDGSYDQQVELLGEKLVKDEMTGIQARVNIVKKAGKVTDEQLKAAYQQVKTVFSHGPQKQIEAVVSPDKAKIEAIIADVAKGMTMQEAAYKNGAVMPGTTGPRKMWMDTERKGESPEILDAMKSTAVNSLTKVLTLKSPNMPSQYLVFKVLAERPKEDRTFDQAKGDIENMVCQQAFQMDPDIQKQFNEKKKAAKISVTDPNLKDVMFTFQYPQEQSPMMMPGMGGPPPTR